MAFDKFKSFWNVDIKDGVRGKAVVQSATMPTESGTSGNVRMWLDVYVEGWEPYRVQHHCMVKHTKYPSPGQTLPVMVDRESKERIDILWEEVKTEDEIMREGAPGQHAGELDLGPLLGGANVTVHESAGQTIDLTGTEMGEQIMEALQAQGLMPQAPRPEAGQPPGAPAESSAPNMVEERIAQLERLAKLRDAGALTDAEFEAEKARVLGGG